MLIIFEIKNLNHNEAFGMQNWCQEVSIIDLYLSFLSLPKSK